jgi:hypothetical protein
MGLIQWILRDPACPQSFKQDMRQLFERMPSPYSLLGSPSTIFPSTSAEERQRVECGLTEVNRSPLVGAKSHLSYASQALSDGKYAEAIRESILAIEGTASTIIGKKATLSDALKVLERDKALHPALKQSFDKLYAYTNDEQGLRHALVSADTASVDEAEAIFMFEASVAFIAFLNRKYLTSSS